MGDEKPCERESESEDVCVRVCQCLESAAEDTESLHAHINKRERARQRGAVHRQLRRVTHREEGETRGRRRPVNRGGGERVRERDGLKTDYQPSTGKEETALRDWSIRPPLPPPPTQQHRGALSHLVHVFVPANFNFTLAHCFL